MSPQAFKKRWNSNAEGGGITFDDIAGCAKRWGLIASPRIKPVDYVMDKVLAYAGVTP